MIPDGMMSLKMASIRFGFSYNTLYFAAIHEALESERIDGRLYVTAEAVEKWRNGNRRSKRPRRDLVTSVSMDRETAEKLRKMCHEKGISRNALIRRAIMRMIVEEEKRNG